MDYPRRKRIRLSEYDYSSPGVYFITVCTDNRKNLLCEIYEPLVGTVSPGHNHRLLPTLATNSPPDCLLNASCLDGPLVKFTEYGEIVRNQLEEMRDFYEDIRIDDYVIMPNHVHLLLRILESENGPSGTTVPTSAKMGRFVGTMKRLTNRKIGFNIWQSRSYDEIVRSEEQYCALAEYIEHNPRLWVEDEHYVI